MKDSESKPSRGQVTSEHLDELGELEAELNAKEAPVEKDYRTARDFEIAKRAHRAEIQRIWDRIKLLTSKWPPAV